MKTIKRIETSEKFPKINEKIEADEESRVVISSPGSGSDKSLNLFLSDSPIKNVIESKSIRTFCPDPNSFFRSIEAEDLRVRSGSESDKSLNLFLSNTPVKNFKELKSPPKLRLDSNAFCLSLIDDLTSDTSIKKVIEAKSAQTFRLDPKSFCRKLVETDDDTLSDSTVKKFVDTKSSRTFHLEPNAFTRNVVEAKDDHPDPVKKVIKPKSVHTFHPDAQVFYRTVGKVEDNVLSDGKKIERKKAFTEQTNFPNRRAVVNSIMNEHCYSRPYNWKPEMRFYRPTKTLYIPKPTYRPKGYNPLIPPPYRAGKIELEAVEKPSSTLYDDSKVHLMNECETYAAQVKSDDDDDDWEENIIKSNWTTAQNHFFNVVVDILHKDNLSRLASSGTDNEPSTRRVIIEKSAKRFRTIFAKYEWDPKLCQWMHQLISDNVPKSYLGIYIDILQTLKFKMPTLVNRLFYTMNDEYVSDDPPPYDNLRFSSLLKQPWDPFHYKKMEENEKKLPGNPIFVIVPNLPFMPGGLISKNLQRWVSGLSRLGSVHTVSCSVGSNMHKWTMMKCVDRMYSATRAKVKELKLENPKRPIVLVGVTSGCGIALQVAQVETLLSVVCLGFSLRTAEGSRGEPDDDLLDLQCPVLFVMGQIANRSFQDNMEDIRERMKVETGLLIVGSADDYLRVTKRKKRAEGINQKIVDTQIIDEVADFLSSLLLSPYPPLLRQSNHVLKDGKKKSKLDRKKRSGDGLYGFDGQSTTSTGLRIRKPVGRPPGKSKKWNGQIGVPPLTPINNINNSITSQPNTQHNPLNDLNSLKNEPNKISKIPAVKTSYTQSTVTSKFTGNFQAMGIPPGRNIYHGSVTSQQLMGVTTRTYPNITTKSDILRKQLITNRRQVIRVPYSVGSTVPPIANNIQSTKKLTSQDIMDLPIIFADDNHLLTNTTILPSSTLSSEILHPSIRPNSNNFVFLTNPKPGIINSNILKRPASTIQNTNSPKLAKILHTQNSVCPAGSSIREVPVHSENVGTDTVVNKINKLNKYSVRSKPTILNETCKPVNFIDLDDDSDDPEYIPNKTNI